MPAAPESTGARRRNVSELASATHASYVAPSSAQGVGHARSLLLPLLFYVFRCAECELRQLPAAPDELASADPSSELSNLLRFRLETLNRSRYTCFNSPSPSIVRSISTPSAYQSLLRLPSMGLKISHRLLQHSMRGCLCLETVYQGQFEHSTCVPRARVFW